MFEHLISVHPPREAIFIDDASAEQIVGAQLATADLLDELGVNADDALDNTLQTDAARKAFGAMTIGAPDAKERVMQIKTPAAVRHLTGMLTAYDWEFVEQAKELRGYTVSKIVEETQNPNASIRLKALQLLGKVTEVGLFTEKIEIKKADMTDEEIDARIKDKLNRFMNVIDVVDVTPPQDFDAAP